MLSSCILHPGPPGHPTPRKCWQTKFLADGLMNENTSHRSVYTAVQWLLEHSPFSSRDQVSFQICAAVDVPLSSFLQVTLIQIDRSFHRSLESTLMWILKNWVGCLKRQGVWRVFGKYPVRILIRIPIILTSISLLLPYGHNMSQQLPSTSSPIHYLLLFKHSTLYNRRIFRLYKFIYVCVCVCVCR